MVQDEAEEVRVPVMAAAALTTTLISSVVTPPLLSVTVKRKVYVPAVERAENEGERVVLLPIVATEGVPPT